jgi:drug/metabolite transporter (DMT)-like permease
MWFFYALFGAVFKASTNFFRKKIAGNIDADVYMWINFFIFLVLLTPLIIITNTPVAELYKQHLLIVICGGIFSNIAIMFSIAALKREELSYIAPLNAFIPIFTLGLAWVFLKESPPIIGVVGILAVFLGAYIINLQVDRVHWYEPITHIFKNSGARFGIGVAIAFASNTVVIKFLTNQEYSAISILYALTLVSSSLLVYVPFTKMNQLKKAIKSHKGILLGVAFSSLFGVLFGMLAIAGTFSSYAISVRRLDIIISVLLGWHLLKETNIRNKLIGSTLMTVGVAIIALT